MQTQKTIGYIYLLRDPRDGQVRYCGYSNNPTRRWKEHITSCDKYNHWTANWIKHLKQAGMLPILQTVIAFLEGDPTPWKVIEQNWIAMMRAAHPRLTNTLDGGDGFTSRAIKALHEKRGPEARSAVAKKANETRGPEARRAAAKRRAETMGPEACNAAAKKANETRGPEARRAAAKKAKKTMGPEARSAAAKRRAETMGPEARSAVIKKAWTTRRMNKQIIMSLPERTVSPSWTSPALVGEP